MLQPCGCGLAAAFYPHEALSSVLPLADVLAQAYRSLGKCSAGTVLLPSLGCLVLEYLDSHLLLMCMNWMKGEVLL